MNIRVAGNHTLFKLGLRTILPSDVVASVPAIDCAEPLVDLNATDRLLLATCSMRARRGAAERLYQAAEALPRDYSLLVVDAFRSQATQELRWQKRIAEMTEAMPQSSPKTVSEAARRFTSPPGGIGSGHQTGGAFDVTLVDASGRPCDMGTNVKEANCLTLTKAAGLTPEQRHLRSLLIKAMTRVGFVNYPNEWWHFSYGDRMWAAYSGELLAIYTKDFDQASS
jgi:D-alanyl-D-alanine dipeptidase